MSAGTLFPALTFAVKPVLNAAGTGLNAGLTAGTAIAGILDPTTTDRIFNPYTEGLGALIQSGDALGKWLPTIATGGVTAATVVDNLNGGTNNVGQVTLPLVPGTANTVEAPSVMTFKVSPQALVITVTSSTW